MTALLAAVSACMALSAGPVDAKLVNPSGGVVQLADFRGKPVLLLFEDRHSTSVNQALKDRLFAVAKQRHLLDRVGLVAVAYLQPFDFFPARQFALAHVRELATKLGIDIFVDFAGSLTRAPLSLPTTNSTVVVLDASGVVIYRQSGPHDERAITTLIELITAEAQRS